MSVTAPRFTGTEAANCRGVHDLLCPEDTLVAQPRQETGVVPENKNRKRHLPRGPFLVLAAATVAMIFKLTIALNTIGTNDVVTFYQFGEQLLNHGLESTYRSSIAFNHPPLTAYYLRAICKLENAQTLSPFHIDFPFLLRLPGILSDFIVVLILLRLNSRQQLLPYWLLALFALSPVSIMVSGFHGNTDSVMVMFLVAAAYMASQNRPLLCGILFALSCQIKIIPLLLVPIAFFFWIGRRRAIPFTIAFTIVCTVLWAEPLLKFPTLFVKNVLTYGSFWGIWGITYWLRLTGVHQFAAVTYFNFPILETIVITLLKVTIIVATLSLAWRRRFLSADRFFASIGYAWLIFFAFSPGVCAQYMVWPAVFALFLSPRFYLWLTATSTLFLFFFYNVISGGLPWHFGNSTYRLNTVWTPWSIWPWAIIVAALILFWRQTKSSEPDISLVSLEPVH
jgi:hypothetical protein